MRFHFNCEDCGVNVFGDNTAHVLDLRALGSGFGVVSYCDGCWPANRAVLDVMVRGRGGVIR